MTKEEILNNCGQNLSKGTKITKEEIIKMARQAGFVDYELDDGTTNAFDKRYEAFAKLVAQHEREACAKACEEVIFKVKPIYCVVAENCVKVIRARGQE